ncbi:MAG: hypothetical protein R3B72_30090 [Polyangiaceae bacterium]
MKSIPRTLLLSLGTALLVACGPSAPPPDVPDAPAGGDTVDTPVDQPTDGGTDTAGGGDWASMSHDAKMEHMQKVVTPKMGALLKEFNGEKVTCATCHGPGAKEGKFEMPNPGLPPLTMPTGDGAPFAKEMEEHPEMTKFMMEKFTPAMVEALPGVKGYNPETHEGFGCFGCHTPAK